MSETIQKVRVPRQKRGIETRERILAAAKTLFSEKSYHTTNSKEIAAAAGVAIGSFYAYFRDKKQVFMEILGLHIQETKAMIMSRLQTIDFSQESVPEAIHLLVHALHDAHNLSPAFHREAEAMRYADPEVEKLHDEFHADFNADFTAFLNAQKDKLRVKDIDAAAHIVIAAAEEIVHASKIFSATSISDARILDALADMICRFLLK